MSCIVLRALLLIEPLLVNADPRQRLAVAVAGACRFCNAGCRYIGFSFTDYYINELRRSVVDMLGEFQAGDAPVAYAIVNDMDDLKRSFYRWVSVKTRAGGERERND